MARESDGLDLILGGHDHHYIHCVEADVNCVKSGSEFREFSVIDITLPSDDMAGERPKINVYRHSIPNNGPQGWFRKNGNFSLNILNFG